MMLRVLMGLAALGFASLSAVACGDDGATETLCKPGEEIFCKCRGGYQGTKTCLDDGASFGECTTLDGPCPEIPDTTSSTSTSSSSSSGGGGGGTGDKALYAPCESGGECSTGTCENGFCTRECVDYTVCSDEAAEAYGDCVVFPGGAKLCGPYCVTQSDCAAYGPSSGCSGATALDDPNFLFAVCGEWGAELSGMPYGTLCEDGTLIYNDQIITAECDLGATGCRTSASSGSARRAATSRATAPRTTAPPAVQAPGCCSSDPDCN
jgi:hypothetical protein